MFALLKLYIKGWILLYRRMQLKLELAHKEEMLRVIRKMVWEAKLKGRYIE